MIFQANPVGAWPSSWVLRCCRPALSPLVQPAIAQACQRRESPARTGASPNPTFTLDTRDGYIQLPDGNTMYMWGYSEGGDAFQHPGPVLCVNQGDTVTVVLQEQPARGRLDHVPRTGERAGERRAGAAAVRRLRNADLADQRRRANGGSVTYSFVASNPGSYIYESGTTPQKQVRMGLFGALIVRPTMGAALRLQPRRQPVHSRTKSSWCCCRRSIRTSTRRWKHGAAVQPQQLPAALLADQRPRLPGLDRRQLRAVPARSAVRRAGPHPSLTTPTHAPVSRAGSITSTSAPRTSRSTRTATTAW